MQHGAVMNHTSAEQCLLCCSHSSSSCWVPFKVEFWYKRLTDKKKKQQHRGYSFKRCIRSFGFPGLYKGGCESLSCMFVHLYTNTPVQAQIRQIQRAGNKRSQHICIHPPARDSAVSVHTTHTTTPLPQSPYSASQPCMRVDRRWVFCTLQHSERADSAVGKILSSEHITNL